MATFASQSPGWQDDLLLVDSTPSRETVKRAGDSSLGGAIADAADYGYCASHSRYFWGLRLHTLMAPDGTPRAMALTSPKASEREYWTAKDILTLERHGARTLRGLRARIASRFLALAAAVALNHQLGRPPRALTDYIA